MITCLEDFVGVMPSACPCMEDAPEGFNPNASLVNYYLTDVLPHTMIDWKRCGEDSMWTRILDSRRRAIQNFSMDFSEVVKSERDSLREVSMNLGDNPIQDATVSETYKGVKLICKNKLGAYLTIKSFKVYVTAVGTATIKIKGSDGVYSKDIAVNISDSANINKWTVVTLEEEIVLPLWSTDSLDETFHYNIYWNHAHAGINKHSCSTCSGGLASDPYFTMTGIKSNTESNWSNNVYQHGLIMAVDIRCGLDFAICESSQFAKTHIGVALAHRWAVDIIDDILKDTEPNRWALIGLEELAKLRNSIMFKDDKDMRASGPYYTNMYNAMQTLNFGACYPCRNRIGRIHQSR